MELVKKHVDTVIVLGGILGAVLWMNSSIHDIENRIVNVEKRLTVIETVMIMQGTNIKGIALNTKDNNGKD
jgi:hypothetical protein